MRRQQSVRDSLYQLLLRLFPSEFRGDFGDDMLADFRDQHEDAVRSGRHAVGRLWRRTIPAMIVAAVRAWLDDLRLDTRLTLRTMISSPGFTAAAILMLAVGTGVNAAMFSVIDSVMLESPFPHQDRLAILRENSSGNATAAISTAHISALAGAGPFAAVGVMTLAGRGGPVLTGLGEPHRLRVECISAGVFDVLETRPLLGRTFTANEDRVGSDGAVVVSHEFWRRELGGETDAIGRTMVLEGAPFTVIGVMPEQFQGPLSRNGLDAWIPLTPGLDGRNGLAGCNARGFVNVFARIHAGLSFSQAEAQANSAATIAELNGSGKRTTLQVGSLTETTISYLRTPLLALSVGALCVLLIACANVANLQLERMAARRREVAVRFALGATRSRVTRQTLTENLFLCAGGTAAGIAAAQWTLPLLVALAPAGIPHLDAIRIHASVLAAMIGVAVVAAIALSIVPAFQTGSRRLAGDLKDSGRSSLRSGLWMRRSLVVLELALSIVLLIAAVLTDRTFLTLRPSQPGFDPSNKVIASVQLPGQPWNDDPANAAFFNLVMNRIRELPGIRSVSASTYVPMSGLLSLAAINIDGNETHAWTSAITPGYLEDMRVPLVRGRQLNASDTAGSAPVAVVNEAMIRRFWPGRDAIGRHIDITLPNNRKVTREIVGVVRDMRSIGSDLETRAEIYVPYAQDRGAFLYLIVSAKNSTDPSLANEIRRTIAEVRQGQVVDQIQSYSAAVGISVKSQRFTASLFSLLAGMAFVLAILGLGAVIAWWVTQRTHEIGIRVALGARRSNIVGLILGQAIALAAAGVAIGLGAAALSTRLLADLLYGVQPLDRLTFTGCAILMLVVAAAASYVPARRAAGIDPLISLRLE